MEPLVELSDLVMIDLKLADDKEHRRWLGRSNEQILDNAARLSGRNVEVRVPLVPGVTDTPRNLEGIFSFMRRAGLDRVGLLPFNPSLGAKYEWLGRTCAVAGQRQSVDDLQGFLTMARKTGLRAHIA
jgi:pyruvate formate lyase activating enzyme